MSDIDRHLVLLHNRRLRTTANMDLGLSSMSVVEAFLPCLSDECFNSAITAFLDKSASMIALSIRRYT